MIYILLSLIVLGISFFLFKKATGTMALTELNLISFNFYYQLILQIFIGTNIVILGLDNHYMLNKITDFSLKQEVYFSVLFVLIVMPLTMWLISMVFKFKAKEEWNAYQGKEIQSLITKEDKSAFITLILFTMVSFVSVVYTFISIGTVPILSMLSEAPPEEVNRLRIIASHEFAGNVYVRNILGLAMTPILSYVAYTYTVKSNFKGWKILFLILFVLSVAILTYNTAKAPVLMYILSFIFLRVLIKGKIKVKTLVIFGAAVSFLLVIFYIFFGGGNTTFLSINSGPIGRILLSQLSSLYFHFHYFPEIIPFLDGRGMPGFVMRMFDMESVRTSRMIMELVNPEGVRNGTAGVMNTIFTAEAYANFGWLGIIGGTIYIGVYIQLIYIFFMRVAKNPLTIALLTYLTYNLPLTGGFFDFIYNPGLIIVIILLISFYISSMIIQRALNKIEKLRERRVINE